MASNGKAVAMICFGMVVDDGERGAIASQIGVESRVYDPRWLPEGFPLSDERKREITFDQLFKHASGLCPEVEEGGRYETDKNYTRWVVGRDPTYRETAPLYYDPGHPEQYARQTRHHFDTYSSIGFQHVGLVLPNLTGMLATIGVEDVDYFEPVNRASRPGEPTRCCFWYDQVTA